MSVEKLNKLARRFDGIISQAQAKDPVVRDAPEGSSHQLSDMVAEKYKSSPTHRQFDKKYDQYPPHVVVKKIAEDAFNSNPAINAVLQAFASKANNKNIVLKSTEDYQYYFQVVDTKGSVFDNLTRELNKLEGVSAFLTSIADSINGIKGSTLYRVSSILQGDGAIVGGYIKGKFVVGGEASGEEEAPPQTSDVLKQASSVLFSRLHGFDSSYIVGAKFKGVMVGDKISEVHAYVYVNTSGKATKSLEEIKAKAKELCDSDIKTRFKFDTMDVTVVDSKTGQPVQADKLKTSAIADRFERLIKSAQNPVDNKVLDELQEEINTISNVSQNFSKNFGAAFRVTWNLTPQGVSLISVSPEDEEKSQKVKMSLENLIKARFSNKIKNVLTKFKPGKTITVLQKNFV